MLLQISPRILAHSASLGLILSAAALFSCVDPPKPAADPAKPTQQQPLYLGEDWASNSPGSTAPPATANPSSSPNANPSPAQAHTVWSLVLGTFTEPGHEDAAQQMIRDLPKVAPTVTGTRVHTTAKGSMVLYGKYTGRDDPAAKADQERLKAITYNGHPVFNRIILTRIDLRLTQGNLHPHDLLSARKAHPKVDPLYTLDVAIWVTDEKGANRQSYEAAQKSAEQYAAQLRARGLEAYFYHDDDHQWSTVTVGLFDRRAINAKSGLFSDAVVNIAKQFPARLMNGEPLIDLKDPKHPELGGTPQTPKLVLVPTM